MVTSGRLSISKTAGLVRCFRFAVFKTYHKWSKKGWAVKQRQGRGHFKIIDAREEWRLTSWFSPHRRSPVALTDEKVKAGSDGQSITACCVWSCVTAECPRWLLNTTESSYTGHVSMRPGPWSDGGRWAGLINDRVRVSRLHEEEMEPEVSGLG